MSNLNGLDINSNIELDDYISAHIDAEEPLLKSLYRETFLKTVNPRMASGHIQGTFLKTIVRMIHPENILELGTFTAYATLSMAAGLERNGHIHTIEINDELEPLINRYIGRSEHKERITLHIGSAKDIVPQIGIMFDMIFIDAEKREYPDYYNLVFDYLKPGGYIIADNTLWDMHVIDPAYSNDAQTAAIRKFNDIVALDSRVEVSIVPIRDGMTIIRKKA